MPLAGIDESRLTGLREVMAGGNDERPASHRRIDDTQPKNLGRTRVLDERAECRADEILSNGLRGVKRSGGFPDTGSRKEAYRIYRRRLIEQRLVDAAKLLDSKIAIGNALTCSVCARPCR